MKRTALGGGLYRDERKGVFWVRPWIGGKRTWRMLDAKTERYAHEELRAKFTAHSRAQSGLAYNSPFQTDRETLADIANLYVLAGCPDKRLQPRGEEFCAVEKDRLKHLLPFFGAFTLEQIRLPLLPKYQEWRVARREKTWFSGNRSVDVELVTLSNVLSYAVAIDRLDVNRIRTGRPKFRRAADVSHSRERAIQTGDELHKLAAYFFKSSKSEAMGWLLLFSAMTGCRNKELRRLRLDAKSIDEPGYIENGFLFIRRAKSGLNPWINLENGFGEMVESFLQWHQTRFPNSPWFFPGRTPMEPLQKDSFRHALYRGCEACGLIRSSPHGLRSFFVTKRRSDGVSDVQIAAEIGDRTVALISQTYGDVPPNWFGKKQLSFYPSEGEPAWVQMSTQPNV
jgi:integrase